MITDDIDEDRIERTEEGEVVYVHADDCGGFCDYACNGTEGDQLADEMNADPDYQKFIDEVAQNCSADDRPCDDCLAGGVCEGPRDTYDAVSSDEFDGDVDDTLDLTECGMHYDDGHNFACELIGSEQCEFCPNRR